MPDTAKRLKATNPARDPFPWIVISRTTNSYGYPEFNQHTIEEAAPTKAHALRYAERRAAEGFWVEVYREHYYHVPQRGQTEDQ